LKVLEENNFSILGKIFDFLLKINCLGKEVKYVEKHFIFVLLAVKLIKMDRNLGFISYQ
jgi:hypothetical protein